MTNPMNTAALNSITGLSLTWEREDSGWVAVCADRNERSAAAAALRAAGLDVSESEGNDDCDDAGTLYLWAAAPTYSYSVQTVASPDPDGDGEVVALDGTEEWATREAAAAALAEIALRTRRSVTEYVVAEFRRADAGGAVRPEAGAVCVDDQGCEWFVRRTSTDPLYWTIAPCPPSPYGDDSREVNYPVARVEGGVAYGDPARGGLGALGIVGPRLTLTDRRVAIPRPMPGI